MTKGVHFLQDYGEAGKLACVQTMTVMIFHVSVQVVIYILPAPPRTARYDMICVR
jgi:hypothetical protein